MNSATRNLSFDIEYKVTKAINGRLCKDIISIIIEMLTCICGSKKETFGCYYKDNICALCGKKWTKCECLKSDPRIKKYRCGLFACIDCGIQCSDKSEQIFICFQHRNDNDSTDLWVCESCHSQYIAYKNDYCCMCDKDLCILCKENCCEYSEPRILYVL